MSRGDGSEPVTDDEVVFRRASKRSGWYDPESDRPYAWVAFRPNKEDMRGLSVWRRKYKTAEQSAAVRAKPGERYFIFRLRVARLREAGIVVEPTPLDGGPGHASLVNINTSAYQQNKNSVRELAEKIAGNLIERVDGPFGPFEI